MVEAIINEIVEETGKDATIIRRVVTSQFLFAKKAQEEKKSYRLPYLGSFVYNEKKALVMESLKNKDEDTEGC